MQTNEDKSRLCALAACVINIIGHLWYIWKNLDGTANPNISSWLVFSFIGLLNLSSYRKITGDWVKSVFPLVNTIFLLILLALIMRHGSFKTLGRTDLSCLILGTGAGLLWWIFKKKEFAPTLVQIILEVSMIIGFIPTIVLASRNPMNESPVGWILWDISFFLQILVVRYASEGKYVEYLFPVNRTFLNSIVVVCLIYNK